VLWDFKNVEHPLSGDALDTVVADLTVQRNAVAGSVRIATSCQSVLPASAASLLPFNQPSPCANWFVSDTVPQAITDALRNAFFDRVP
jgi:hypothetical protein